MKIKVENSIIVGRGASQRDIEIDVDMYLDGLRERILDAIENAPKGTGEVRV